MQSSDRMKGEKANSKRIASWCLFFHQKIIGFHQKSFEESLHQRLYIDGK